MSAFGLDWLNSHSYRPMTTNDDVHGGDDDDGDGLIYAWPVMLLT